MYYTLRIMFLGGEHYHGLGPSNSRGKKNADPRHYKSPFLASFYIGTLIFLGQINRFSIEKETDSMHELYQSHWWPGSWFSVDKYTNMIKDRVSSIQSRSITCQSVYLLEIQRADTVPLSLSLNEHRLQIILNYNFQAQIALQLWSSCKSYSLEHGVSLDDLYKKLRD